MKDCNPHPWRAFPAIVCLLCAPPLAAETTQCTTVTGVTVISSQGIYCLTANIGTDLASGKAIEIITNNVTIDLNGYKIGNLAAGKGTAATGIDAENRKNITVRNGIVRGFRVGVNLTGTSGSGHLVEDMILDGNIASGVAVEGSGVTVRDNRVVNTGDAPSQVTPSAISVSTASSARVLGNTVYNTVATSSDAARGISLSNADYCVVQGNRVIATQASSGEASGIHVSDSDSVSVVGNVVLGVDSTGATGYGIKVAFSSTDTQIIDNRVSGAANGIDCNSNDNELRDNAVADATTEYDCPVGADQGGNT